MSDSSQQQEKASPTTKVATMDAGAPPKSDVDSSKTPAPMPTRDARREFTPGSGEAIFSTDLCTRAPRRAPGPPFPPVIVRGSDPIKAVVDAAAHWQKKFKWQCLCIFPNQKWNINDLWDGEDLHFDSPGFCQKMLTFIERDTYYAAAQFAKDWLKAHPDPDRMSFITGDALNAYDPNRPSTSMLNKIFVYGEMQSFPSIFLSHVTCIMRMQLAEKEQARIVSVRDSRLPGHQAGIPGAKFGSGGMVPTEVGVSRGFSSKNNMPNQDVPTSLPTFGPTAMQPAMLPVTLSRSALRTDPTHGSSQSFHDHEIVGDYGARKTATLGKAADGLHHGMKPLKGKNRNIRAASYNHPVPPQGWVENIHHQQPSLYNRHVPNVQSPQFHPATMAIGQPVLMPHNPMQPFAHGLTMMGSGMPNQQYEPGVLPRGMLPSQPLPMQPQMVGQAYLQQPPHAQNGRGYSIGDVTNTVYYSNNTLPPQVDPRGLPSRHTSHSNNGGVLFDPYGGSNAKFRDASVSHGSSKSTQHSFTNHPTRLRKVSVSSSRHAHVNDRSISSTISRFQQSDSPLMRTYPENDPAITGDAQYGCSQLRIGPDNTSVDEVFVGDLPEDVQEFEIKHLFEQHGISPTRVVIRSPGTLGKSKDYGRWHAFVSFSSSSDAKKAFKVRDQNPSIREGSVTVSITVPKRFYQKDFGTFRRSSLHSGSFNTSSYPNRGDEREPRSIKRKSSHDEEHANTNMGGMTDTAIYSPQDARSDLCKTAPQTTDPRDNTATGSPEAHKAKTRPNLPTKEKTSKRGSPAKKSKAVATETTESMVVENTATSTSAKPDDPIAKDDNKLRDQLSKKANEKSETVETDRSVVSDAPTIPSMDVIEEKDLPHDTTLLSPKQEKSSEISPSSEKPSDQKDSEPDAKAPPGEVSESCDLGEANTLVEDPVTVAKTSEPEQPSEEDALLDSAQSGESDALNDDEKNEDSFLSAKESLAESESTELQPLCVNDPDTVDQVTLDQPQRMAAEPVGSEGINSSLVEKKDFLPTQLDSPSSTTPRVQITEPEPESSSIDSPGVTSTSSQVGLTVPKLDILSDSEASIAKNKSTTAAPTRVSGAMAPPGSSSAGAQRVESLSPFAKPSKAQQKKEKEAKKKQQKKAEAEKAKAASSSQVQSGSSAETDNKTTTSPRHGATKADMLTDITGQDAKATAKVGYANKKAKKQPKALIESNDQEKPVEFGAMKETTTSPSASSSMTLQAEEEATKSPTKPKEEFATTQQTTSPPIPSTQGDVTEPNSPQADTQQDEAPKKKKKKPKKRSKKAAEPSGEPSEAMGTSQATKQGELHGKKTSASHPIAPPLTKPENDTSTDGKDDIRYDPFHSRMSTEEAARRGLKDPSAAWKQFEDERAAAKARMRSESSLKRQIEAYMRENPSWFKVEAEASS